MAKVKEWVVNGPGLSLDHRVMAEHENAALRIVFSQLNAKALKKGHTFESFVASMLENFGYQVSPAPVMVKVSLEDLDAVTDPHSGIKYMQMNLAARRAWLRLQDVVLREKGREC